MNATRTQPVDMDLLDPIDRLPTEAPESLAWAAPRRRWLVAVIVLASLGILGFGLRALVSDVGQTDNTFVYYTVHRTDLPITVMEQGNLESQITEEIMCEVENFGDRSGNNGTQILFIVPNGCSVKKGDLLVELDSAPLKERLDNQFLSLEKAEAEMIQSGEKYKNQITQNETSIKEAELRLELATMDAEMFGDEEGGTFAIELKNVEMDIQKARAEQMIRKTDLEAIKLLYKLGYKSKGDLAAARLELLRANSNLATQLASRTQLTKYTWRMKKLDLEGKLATSEQNVKQVKLNNDASLAQAKAEKDAGKRAYDKEKERYDRYQEQLDKCKITAPQDGMVAYAVGNGRHNRGTVVEEGAFVRQHQQILTLPNLSTMQVNTAVHESVLDQVKVGLRAVIRIDAFSDHTFRGSVKSVAVLPDPGGWLNSDTKVYKTIVTIDEEVTQLKPGMTAVVEIKVAQLKNVISVPVQAIVQREDSSSVYVRGPDGIQKKKVVLGKTNDKFVEIRDGLQEGETVILNPMSIVDQEPDQKGDVKKGRSKEAGGNTGSKKAAGDSGDAFNAVQAVKKTKSSPGLGDGKPAPKSKRPSGGQNRNP